MKIRHCEQYLMIKDIEAAWSWYDTIDANTYSEALSKTNKGIWGYIESGIEGTWHYIGDVGLDVRFKVRIDWEDYSSGLIKIPK